MVYSDITRPKVSPLSVTRSSGSSRAVLLFFFASKLLDRMVICPARHMWWDLCVESLNRLGAWSAEMRQFQRRTKMCARAKMRTNPLAKDRCKKFYPLCDPLILLPSKQISSLVLVRQPLRTCASWSW